VTIDAYTQPGSASNTDPRVSNAVILVQLKGAGATEFNGLVIASANNVVRGLAFFNLNKAIYLYSSNAHYNVISGDFIGTDASGTFVSPAEAWYASGVVLEQGAAYNRIGGDSPAERNVISGNAFNGVALYHWHTDYNMILNNLVGLGPTGDRQVKNYRHGIDINFTASYNIVGGSQPYAHNVTSGNVRAGIEISHGPDTRENQIVGNFVGTDVTGTSATAYTANGYPGIYLTDGAISNTIASNVIGNNRTGGIFVRDIGTNGNHLYSNRIGVSLDGSAIPNSAPGVRVDLQAEHTVVGPDNIIASNLSGIEITGTGTLYNTITRNSIYGNTIGGIELGSEESKVSAQGTVDGPNQDLHPPLLSKATTTQITGSACLTCTVELFQADAYGQGKRFLGMGTVDAHGSFIVHTQGLVPGDAVTATETDALGNTSEFASAISIGWNANIYLPTVVN